MEFCCTEAGICGNFLGVVLAFNFRTVCVEGNGPSCGNARGLCEAGGGLGNNLPPVSGNPAASRMAITD